MSSAEGLSFNLNPGECLSIQCSPTSMNVNVKNKNTTEILNVVVDYQNTESMQIVKTVFDIEVWKESFNR